MQKRKSFRVSKLGLALATAFAAQSGLQLAHAGPGWGDNVDYAGKDIKVPTFYANSPSGVRKNYNPYLNNGTGTVDTGKALRKFVDTLPGLTPAGANNLGQYIPLAVADKTSYPGSDYYEIAVVEYTEKMHSDLPKGTTLRGYVQIETAANAGISKHIPLTYPNGQPILDNAGNPVFAVDNPHYLGPTVLATKGTATRFKFSNYLPAGTVNGLATGAVAAGQVVTREGDLFLPVDKTLLGANAGPEGHLYTQNRAAVHLHGGDTPWISDGTPHQWIAPHNQAAPNPAGATPAEQLLRGVSARNVPDMPDPGPGSLTFYFPNNQSARLMFYHDHTSGLTRVNVYAGEAAGYVLMDQAEQDLITAGVIPGLDAMIPLVIQDKTFVPQDIAEQDARWDQNAWGKPGDLWFPHVYETNQDPNAFDGTNPVGRWDYGPWFWPVFPAPLALPTGVYGDVSTTPEAFMDTPVINGTAYPVLNVDPKAYRFRILNAANDRFLNMGLYVADGNRTTDDGRSNTEVKMVPATMTGSPLAPCAFDGANNEISPKPGAACWPSYWPTDGRREGVPDPATAGPDIVVIGNEGGFIPNPHVIPSSPIVYELNRRSITVLNVLTSGLYLGNAERADAIIDFSAYAGKTLILYNDSPAPVPAVDPRVDYQTDNEDLTTAGGAESTKAGYGPNIRTMMQIRVANKPAAPAFDVAKLQAELPKAYAKGADKPIIGQSAYNAAFGTHYVDTYAKIRTGSGQQPDFIWTANEPGQTITSIDMTDGGLGYIVAPTVVISGGNMVGGQVEATASIANGRVTGVTITNMNGATFSAMPTITFSSDRTGGLGATASVRTTLTQSKRVLPKAIHELFDPNYGRMNAVLAIELPFTSALVQTTVPLGYVDPATEILQSATYQLDANGKPVLMANGEPVELNPDGKTQIWKITHNGVDTHPVHFHLMNVQLINRIGWDGTIKFPSASELGWKETLKMNPLEDVVIAISPKTPAVPFGVPLSTRYRDPAQTPNGIDGFTQIDFAQTLADGVTLNPNFGLTVPGGTVKNTLENYEWEYVWHCHILGHEENDFMRPVVYKFNGERPGLPTAVAVTNEGIVTWVDDTPAADATTKYSKKNEIGFRVERAPYDAAGVKGAHVILGTTLSNATTFTDADAILPANAGKKFNYRVVAFNDLGTATSVGFDLTIAGAGVPNAPTNLVANVVSSSVVNLTWADNATDESGFKVTRCVWATNPATNTGECVAGSVTTVATLAANVLSYSDTTAMADTQYQYQIVATNAAGPSAQALSNVVKTLPAPAIAPVGLAAVRHAVNKDTSVVLTWTDKSNNENGFLVQRSADGGQTWTDVCVAGCSPITQLPLPVPPAAANTINVSVVSATPATVNGVVTLTDTGLTQNTQYLYRVAAVTAAGAAQTMPVTITTDYAAAPAVGAITSTPDYNRVSLSWPVAAPSTQFEIVRTGGAGATVITTVAGNAVGAMAANTWVDNNVVQHTAYTYTVRAINGPYRGATVSTANVTTFYAPAPAMAMVQANATTNASGAKVVALNWTTLASSDTATGVRIMRCLETAANFNCTSPSAVFEEVYRKDVGADGIANTIGSSWTDSKVSPANGYTYRAYFVNGVVGTTTAENAGATNLAHVDVPQAFAMNAPINFTASYTQGRTYTNLAWTDNSGDLVNGVPTINETAFIVERSIDGINFSQVGTVPASAGIGAGKSYTDPTVAPGQVYTYRVKAVSVIGGSTTSSPATAAVAVDMRLGAPSNLSAAVTATTIAVTFTDNALFQDTTGFAIKRSADGGATWTQIGTASAVAGAGGTRTYNDATALTLVPGATYQYAVEAIWTYAGLTYRSELSAPVSATVLPVPAPTNVTGTLTAPGYVAGTPTVTNGRIRVSFKDNALNESNFEVERSGDGGATWTPATLIAASTANTAPTMTWDDLASVTNPLTVGTTYQYRLRAVNVTNGVTTKSADAIGSVLFDKPVAPLTATVTSPGNQTNRITWTLAAGNTGADITVWARKRNANGTWPAAYTNLRTVGITTAFTNHTGLNAGDGWQYEVRVNNNLGSSAFVETATITVAP